MLNFGEPVDRLSELLQFLLHPLQDLLPRFGTVRISMGKVAHREVGRSSHILSCDETAGDRLSIYAARQRGYSLRNAATGLTFVARRAGT